MFPITSADVDQVCTWVIFQTKSNRLIVVPRYFLLLWSGTLDAFFHLILCVWLRVGGREYWMIYRGPGFLSVVWFCCSPIPSPVARQQVVTLPGCCWSTYWRERGGWGGAKLYDGEKAWSFINHSILSALTNRLNLIYNSVRSHPNSTRYHPQLGYVSSTTLLGIIHTQIHLIHTRLDLIHTRLDIIHTRVDIIHNRLNLIRTLLDLIHSRLDLIHTRLSSTRSYILSTPARSLPLLGFISLTLRYSSSTLG